MDGSSIDIDGPATGDSCIVAVKLIYDRTAHLQSTDSVLTLLMVGG